MKPPYMTHSFEVPPGEQAISFVCEACGNKMTVLLPLDIDTLAAIGKAFTNVHAHKDSGR